MKFKLITTVIMILVILAAAYLVDSGSQQERQTEPYPSGQTQDEKALKGLQIN